MHLYVHVPFCARRCSYCDFAIAVRPQVPDAAYLAAVTAEWEAWQAHPAWGEAPEVRTIYFGGGTPSRLEPASIAALVRRLRTDRPVVAGAEITLEANPDDVTDARATEWAAAGITRVSLGVQSFDDAVLAWMHRTHTSAQVGAAVAALRRAGIAHLSLDLIGGVPEALGRSWRDDLAAALALEAQHLSLYLLTVEPHTPLGHWTARGTAIPAPDSTAARDFLEAHATLTTAGYEHYEVSNYARPGARAQHNSAYWRRAPWIGLGPSAHSGLGRERRWNHREWEAYRRALAGGAPAQQGGEWLDDAADRLERLYTGLRTVDGVAANALPAPEVARWIDAGWARTRMAHGESRVALTPEGWLRLDALVARVA